MKKTKKKGKFKKEEQPDKKRGVIDARAKQSMLAVVFRNPHVLEQVRDVLKVKYVATIDDGYSIIYKCILAFYDEHKEMPSKSQLLDELQQFVADHASQINDMEVESMAEFVELCYDSEEWGDKDISKDKSHAKTALKSVTAFVHELAASGVQELYSGNKVVANVADALTGALTLVRDAEAIQAAPVGKIFDDGWMDEEQSPPISTGIPVFDTFMGGGFCKREVVTFMGPYGSCKTTIAVMGVCEGAKIAQTLTLEAQKSSDKKIKRIKHVAVLASYEMPVKEMRHRCLAYVAKIPRSRLTNMKNLKKELRSHGEPLPYEKEQFHEMIEKGLTIPTEMQRVEAAVALLNEYVLFLDMTTRDPDDPHGAGGVPELAKYLRAEIRRDKKHDLQFESVYVDHAAAMVTNMMGTDDYSVGDDSTRRLLKGIPKQLGDLVAKAFDTPVFVLHQMNGEANSRNPAAEFHHTDSDECKSFGMYPDFCIVTGPQTKDGEQLCVFDCTKHRREPPRKRQIVRVEGNYNRIRSMDKKYTVDEARKKIVTWDEYHSVNGGGKSKNSAKTSSDEEAELALGGQ